MYLRPLIAAVVGAVLFAALAYYAQPLAAEGPNFRRIILIGLGGALAIGAAAVIIAGHQRWVWLGGVLSPLAGSILYLTVFVAPLGGEQGADAVSPEAVVLTCLQYLPTALAGALVAGHALRQVVRPRPPAVEPQGSSGGRAG